METKNVLFSKPYLDIVFENRNQEYGAYQLRQEYERNVAIGLFSMLATIVVVFLAGFVYDHFHHAKPLHFTEGKHTITEVVLPKEKIEIVEQPPVKKGVLPPTPAENLAMKVVQNPAQELKKDSVIENQPLAYSEHGTAGEIGAENGTEGGVNILPEVKPVEPKPSALPVSWAEIMPEFMGGENAMTSFIRSNMEYLVIERENGINGSVVVSFVVNEDGRVSDIKTLKATTKNFQRASEEVVAKFPKFKPGMQDSKPVKVRMTIPIKFVTE